jgi:hypothetical protein
VLVLLVGGPAWPFNLAVSLLVLCGLEESAIAMILPGYSGQMPSVWHAWRRRRQLLQPPA